MTLPRRLDLHVHSALSPDGRSSVDDLVRGLPPRGLDGLAITDHNTVSGHARLAELAGKYPDLRLIPGVEVSTRDGHLLAYGVTVVPPTGRSVDETVEWVTARGGVAVLAHPFRRVHGVGGPICQSAQVPAVETVNGHNGAGANRRAEKVAAARGLGTTGGSDAHSAAELGRAWTRFPGGTDSANELLEALRRGATAAEGRSATPLERSRIAIRSLGLRLRRGLRPL